MRAVVCRAVKVRSRATRQKDGKRTGNNPGISETVRIFAPRKSTAGCHSFEFQLKTIKILLIRRKRVSPDPLVFGNCLKDLSKRNPGFVGLLFKSDDDTKARTRDMVENDPRGLYDFNKDDLILVVDAIGTVQDKTPHAAGTGIHFMNSA